MNNLSVDWLDDYANTNGLTYTPVVGSCFYNTDPDGYMFDIDGEIFTNENKDVHFIGVFSNLGTVPAYMRFHGAPNGSRSTTTIAVSSGIQNLFVCFQQVYAYGQWGNGGTYVADPLSPDFVIPTGNVCLFFVGWKLFKSTVRK